MVTETDIINAGIQVLRAIKGNWDRYGSEEHFAKVNARLAELKAEGRTGEQVCTECERTNATECAYHFNEAFLDDYCHRRRQATYTVRYFRTPEQGVNESGRGVAIFNGDHKIVEVSVAPSRADNLKRALLAAGINRSNANLKFEHY